MTNWHTLITTTRNTETAMYGTHLHHDCYRTTKLTLANYMHYIKTSKPSKHSWK